MKIIDLSMNLNEECMTCGTIWHAIPKIKQLGTINEVGRNTHEIYLGTHTATHVDAPLHFVEGGKGIDSVDLEQICGEVKIIDFSNKKAGEVVTLEEVQNIKIADRMLFKFHWYQYWKTEQYYKDFPYFEEKAVEYLVENGMKFMALDTPSPDSANDISNKQEKDSPNHKYMLERGIIIAEYLCNTENVCKDKQYDIIALPLKIENVDGSPARIILIERGNN